MVFRILYKMEVPYHKAIFCGDIPSHRPYIGLTYIPYMLNGVSIFTYKTGSAGVNVSELIQ